MERAYDDAKFGRFSERPYIDCIMPTMVDPSMAPPGKHIMSCFVQYAPYKLEPGKEWNDAEREAFGENVIDTLEERFPDIRSKILHKMFITPKDIEDVTGLTEGNIFQGELSLGAAVLQPARARMGAVPHAGEGPVDVRLGHAPRRRHHGRAGPHRCARVPEGEQARNEGGLSVARSERVVVIGAGHNGLVAAAYLAKAGKKVVVLERRDVVGGILANTEIAPGFTAPGIAHTVGRLRRSVIKDLKLQSHGLELLAPDVRMFAPQPDGSAVTFWGDAARTASELQTRNPHDAGGLPGVRQEGPRGRELPLLHQRDHAARREVPVDRRRDRGPEAGEGVPRPGRQDRPGGDPRAADGGRGPGVRGVRRRGCAWSALRRGACCTPRPGRGPRARRPCS